MKSEQQPERWRQSKQLYHAALGRDAGQRAAFLAEACAERRRLRSRIAASLATVGAHSVDAPGC
jgi:hypothetical protein